jgi:dihydrofolate reductase
LQAETFSPEHFSGTRVNVKNTFMRDIIAFNHISLDGYVAGPGGEMNWIKHDQEIFDFVGTFIHVTDAALYGRVTWQMMENYWPSIAHKPDATDFEKKHLAWYNKAEKIVVSASMKGQKRDNTRFIGGDVAGEIRKLKQEHGSEILIFGSPSLVRSLMKENLIDGYRLFVNPVILGNGISMYGKADQRIELITREIKTFNVGVTAFYYRIKG